MIQLLVFHTSVALNGISAYQQSNGQPFFLCSVAEASSFCAGIISCGQRTAFAKSASSSQAHEKFIKAVETSGGFQII